MTCRSDRSAIARTLFRPLVLVRADETIVPFSTGMSRTVTGGDRRQMVVSPRRVSASCTASSAVLRFVCAAMT
ncbi:MAG: hypothetical protein IPG04_05205 [Polyangiaceae bacterium]|nr:hypothetical protein [Polyangiaceae bacterium]